MVHHLAALAGRLARMNTHSPEYAGEGYFLSDHCQGGARPPPGDITNIARDVYPSRTSAMTREGKIKYVNPSDISANANTAFTENAIVVVSNKERAICPSRQAFGQIRR